MIYNGKIILIFEAIDKFTEKDGYSESRLKFWFPKYFPTRFRVIVTASKASQSYAYLKKVGCQSLHLETTTDTLHSVCKSYLKRQFIMDDRFKEQVFEILRKKITDGSVQDTLLIKTVIGCLCPYQTPQIITISPQTTARLTHVLRSFDIQR